MNKKRLSAALAITMLAGSFVPSLSYAAATENAKVNWLVEQKWVLGRDGGDLALDATIQRAEFVKMVLASKGLLAEAETKKDMDSKFKDVSKDHWANGFINLAVEKGLVMGDENGNFRPDDKISYNEILTILARLNPNFKEVKNEGANWSDQFVKFAKDNGYLAGVNVADSDFATDATREKTFEIIYNFYHAPKATSKNDIYVPSTTNEFAWPVWAIMGSNSGTGYYRPTTPVRPVEPEKPVDPVNPIPYETLQRVLATQFKADTIVATKNLTETLNGKIVVEYDGGNIAYIRLKEGGTPSLDIVKDSMPSFNELVKSGLKRFKLGSQSWLTKDATAEQIKDSIKAEIKENLNTKVDVVYEIEKGGVLVQETVKIVLVDERPKQLPAEEIEDTVDKTVDKQLEKIFDAPVFKQYMTTTYDADTNTVTLTAKNKDVLAAALFGSKAYDFSGIDTIMAIVSDERIATYQINGSAPINNGETPAEDILIGLVSTPERLQSTDPNVKKFFTFEELKQKGDVKITLNLKDGTSETYTVKFDY